MNSKIMQAVSATLLIGSVLGFSNASNAYEVASERQSYGVGPWGYTAAIPEQDIAYLCGDFDGCTLRIGMYNWDGTGRTASRESLFYYNSATKTWRASAGDTAGLNGNGVTEHVMQAWSCYFTDGQYSGFTDLGDYNSNFGLLSWNQYYASCRLTIID